MSSQPLRVAHLSDLHFSPEHLEEVDRCMTAAVEGAAGEKVDVAVISGDSTDHRVDLHSPSVQKLASHIHDLSNHCPVLMLQGTFSHEPPGALAVFQFVGGRYPVFVATEIQQVALLENGQWASSLALETPDWRFSNETLPGQTKALFSCLPTVNKADMVAAIGADDHAAIGEVLADLLAGFAPANIMARDRGIPTLGVSHGTVHGCITEHGVPMIGFDHEFTTGSLFSAKASAYLLGHIHKHQVWENALPGYGTQRIAYAGSIGRLHYGEEGEKGWLYWGVDHRNAACRLMPTPARKLLHIDFDGSPDIESITQAVRNNPGSFVRIRYTVDEDQRHTVDRESLQKLVEQAGAMDCKIEGRIIPVTRVRAEGISQSHTLQDKLQKWCESTNTKPEPLLDRLEMLTHMEPDALVQNILKDPQRLKEPPEQPKAPSKHTLKAEEPAGETPDAVPTAEPAETTAKTAASSGGSSTSKDWKETSLMDLF